ncbi:hypothetical protein DQ400_18450 [Vreelandella sulfidaeris]|uniref:Uncharacterized protein n=1 Tax=Vreelandella sulfidaeris TaxID=115553 RepID=A0A365TIM3_9GAMM|nr:hypothetical protein [Halomonas sulfidaeris]RBI65338.1 hypothetical protein DQ400_18450 [Halomonas sulfidaeris]
MKINVEFDLTPDEFRQSLGLPNVEAFQKNLLDNIQRQMESGVEGYDPMSLMRPFLQQPMMQQGLSQGLSEGLSQGLANFGTYQQMMLDMLRQAGSASTSSADNEEAEKESDASTKSGANNATGSSTKSTASSRSRSGTSSRSTSKRSGT